MRFLEVRADKVEFGRAKDVNNADVAALKILNVSVRILGATVLRNLTAYIFAGQNRTVSFALFAGNDTANIGSLGPITVRWFLIGHEVSINDLLAASLVSISYSPENEDVAASKQIRAANDAQAFLAGTRINQGRWIFAAGFQLAGLLDAKFLFQDQAYYGIALGGGIFDNWFGYNFAISVLYIKGQEPSQDSFRISIRVPRVTLPSFQFMGGELTLQIGLDGGFLLDIGFPHLSPDGSRRWDRALGAIITPLQGSGGFYIQKHAIHTPTSDGGLLISAGYAVQAGLGAAFGGGVFTVWVTAGFFYILEGAIALHDTNLQGLRLAGSVGILIRGGGRLNFWIISVTVEIVVSAEARIAFAWGKMPNEYLQIGSGPLEVEPGKVRISFDITLYARASAEACIGGGWFRFCAGISVSIPMRYPVTIEV